MAERAAREGFEAGEPVSISYIGQWNAYTYSSQPSWGSRNIIYFDPDTRQVLFFSGMKQARIGNVIDRWLIELHVAHRLGRAYEAFVAVLGLVITMFSVTGVYLWWKKCKVRTQGKAQMRSDTTTAVA